MTRQWKNILYMPILAENNFKSKKKVTPYTVTFAIPQEESIDNFQTAMDDEQSLLDNNFEVLKLSFLVILFTISLYLDVDSTATAANRL